MKKNNKKGFTIVELVIVIAVIAILAAVLIPTFSGIITKANNSADFQEARNAYTEYLAKVDAQPASKVYAKGGTQYFEVVNGKMDSTPDTPSGTDHIVVYMSNNAVVIDCAATPAQDATHKTPDVCTVCKGQDTAG